MRKMNILLLLVFSVLHGQANKIAVEEGFTKSDTLSAYFTEQPNWLRLYAKDIETRSPIMTTLVEGLPPVNIDQDTLSLPPEYFPEMPEQLRVWLEIENYRIPQVHDWFIEDYTENFLNIERYNVISGDFNGTDKQDWAMATFRNDTLKAFVCWDADTSRIEQLDISEFITPFRPIGRRLTFEIISAVVQSEWLNIIYSFSGPFNLDGDNSVLPIEFSHDGFLFDSGGDMWDGGFIRYYHNGSWIRFNHYYARCCATCGPKYCNQLIENRK